MKINILAFGQIAEIAGSTEWESQDIENADNLRIYLEGNYPQLKSVKYSIAVNRRLIHGNEKFNDNDTVALLPPFSGG
mgnify:CR=1 FL=1